MHAIHVVHLVAARFDAQARLVVFVCFLLFSFYFSQDCCARGQHAKVGRILPAECAVPRPRRSPRSLGCSPPARTPVAALIACTPFPDDAASLTCRARRSRACRPSCSASRSQILCQPLQRVAAASAVLTQELATNLCCRATSAADMEAAARSLGASCVSPAPARSMRPQRDWP